PALSFGVAPADVRSCPTRRSSDLTTARAGPGSGVDVVLHEHAAQQLAGGVARQIVEEDHVARHLVAGQVALDVGLDLLRVGLRLDRKSTRLNSSHVKISYAVLCLK